MRFAFTAEQLEFRDAVRDLFEKECPPDAVREAWANGSGRVPGLWDHLEAMGVAGLTAPESEGGLGLDALDLVLLLEESGRFAVPEPLVEHTAVALPALRDAGHPTTGTWTVQLAGAPFAMWGDSVDHAVVERDGRLVAGTPVVERVERAVDGSRRLAVLTLADEVVLDGADPALAFDRGALGTAAQLVGLADRMIAMTVEYAKDRHQFGVPIGSFQAVKHHLANARVALEFARPLVHRAAHSVAHADAARSTHVSMAKASASEAAAIAARAALQCHGAIGYTTEHDLHLFMKRAWALAASWGDAAWHRRRVGAALALTPPSR